MFRLQLARLQLLIAHVVTSHLNISSRAVCHGSCSLFAVIIRVCVHLKNRTVIKQSQENQDQELRRRRNPMQSQALFTNSMTGAPSGRKLRALLKELQKAACTADRQHLESLVESVSTCVQNRPRFQPRRNDQRHQRRMQVRLHQRCAFTVFTLTWRLRALTHRKESRKAQRSVPSVFIVILSELSHSQRPCEEPTGSMSS